MTRRKIKIKRTREREGEREEVTEKSDGKEDEV